MRIEKVNFTTYLIIGRTYWHFSFYKWGLRFYSLLIRKEPDGADHLLSLTFGYGPNPTIFIENRSLSAFFALWKFTRGFSWTLWRGHGDVLARSTYSNLKDKRATGGMLTLAKIRKLYKDAEKFKE